jgi:metal-responsive CopG/Arc/MetJ family transcriptional regulator
MEKGVKIQVTLAPGIAESLDRYCQKKGLKRSAAVALALNELWREERFDEK